MCTFLQASQGSYLKDHISSQLNVAHIKKYLLSCSEENQLTDEPWFVPIFGSKGATGL